MIRSWTIERGVPLAVEIGVPLLVDVETTPGLPALLAVGTVDVGTWVVGVGPSTVQVYSSISIQHIHSRHTVLTLLVLSSYIAGWVYHIYMSGITIQYITWCNCHFTFRK